MRRGRYPRRSREARRAARPRATPRPRRAGRRRDPAGRPRPVGGAARARAPLVWLGERRHERPCALGAAPPGMATGARRTDRVSADSRDRAGRAEGSGSREEDSAVGRPGRGAGRPARLRGPWVTRGKQPSAYRRPGTSIPVGGAREARSHDGFSDTGGHEASDRGNLRVAELPGRCDQRQAGEREQARGHLPPGEVASGEGQAGKRPSRGGTRRRYTSRKSLPGKQARGWQARERGCECGVRSARRKRGREAMSPEPIARGAGGAQPGWGNPGDRGRARRNATPYRWWGACLGDWCPRRTRERQKASAGPARARPETGRGEQRKRDE